MHLQLAHLPSEVSLLRVSHPEGLPWRLQVAIDKGQGHCVHLVIGAFIYLVLTLFLDARISFMR
jgi:hypothetical protein